jgi:hypothetical protein
VILLVAGIIAFSGVASIIQRGPLRLVDRTSTADAMVPGAALEPIGVVTHAEPIPIAWTEDEDDDDVAPWIVAAGWNRGHRHAEATETAGGPAPADLAAADPFGIVPDDPAAVTRAETESIELPWGPEGPGASAEPRTDRDATPGDPDPGAHRRG